MLVRRVLDDLRLAQVSLGMVTLHALPVRACLDHPSPYGAHRLHERGSQHLQVWVSASGSNDVRLASVELGKSRDVSSRRHFGALLKTTEMMATDE